MNIKKFIANSPQEALNMVKKEMGPDAVILKTRTIGPTAGYFGKGQSKIEVTAAIDYEALHNSKAAGEQTTDTHSLAGEGGLESQLKEIWDSLMALEARIMKRAATEQEVVYHSYFGLDSNVTKELMSDAPRGVKSKPKANVVKECLISVLKHIRTTPGEGRIFSFVGPTGVGKTTTLAKLAALSSLDYGKKTALITVDTFRIGAVEQLHTYARIMGVPLSVASNAVELRRAIRSYSDFDLIFIDTAGRSPGNKRDLARLLSTFNTGDPIHHYLVLSATTRVQDLWMAESKFGALPLGSYIFTKLDEATDISDMLNFLLTRQRPVSYFTTGQKVPEDIERATRRRVAEWILKRKRRVEHQIFTGVGEDGSSQSAQAYS